MCWAGKGLRQVYDEMFIVMGIKICVPQFQEAILYNAGEPVGTYLLGSSNIYIPYVKHILF